MNINHYLRQPHPANCDCSVCWSSIQMAQAKSVQSTPCIQCRPAGYTQVNGRWYSQPASFCAKHTPSHRPPQYWHVVHDSGKPTPFVPLREPQHDA